MIDSQYIFPATLSALTILATVLNFTAHFSNGEYLSWKAFNRISLATLLSMTVCIFAWMIHSRAGMLSSLQLVENNLGNMALILLGSMFVVYQEFILFKNVLSWIGRKAVPMDLSYSLYAILVPLVVMIIKIPFSSPLDMFPEREHLVFMLWGAYAKEKAALIDSSKHLILTTVHPSPRSAEYGFFGCRHFSKANDYLRSKGIEEIDW